MLRISAQHLGRPGIGFEDAEHHLDQGGLAGPVRTQQTGDSLADGDVDLVERCMTTESLCEARCGDHVMHGGAV